jgi:hypothetical protein
MYRFEPERYCEQTTEGAAGALDVFLPFLVEDTLAEGQSSYRVTLRAAQHCQEVL